MEKQTETKNKLKNATQELFVKLEHKYYELNEEKIKFLVLEEKWMAQLSNSMMIELDDLSQTLTMRVSELADRYTIPLQTLDENVEKIKTRVENHLKKMGVSWK